MIVGMSAQPNHRHPIHLTERGDTIKTAIEAVLFILVLPISVAAILWMLMP